MTKNPRHPQKPLLLIMIIIPSILVKNMTDKVILGIPFINSLYPFLSEHDGITIDLFGQKVKFKFASRFEIDTDAYLNLIHAKTNI